MPDNIVATASFKTLASLLCMPFTKHIAIKYTKRIEQIF
ncbi:hypothetical protein PLIP_a0836 [Pseudoalteromonas lipolytica LMEB 39]|nr:hypothetical protein [Pseudoalteromonas lipolytica LMEB 39]